MSNAITDAGDRIGDRKDQRGSIKERKGEGARKGDFFFFCICFLVSLRVMGMNSHLNAFNTNLNFKTFTTHLLPHTHLNFL